MKPDIINTNDRFSGLGPLFLFCLAILSLFASLGYYAFPIADDHSYALKFARMPFTELLIDLYLKHSGRFVCNILFAPLASLSNNLTLYHLFASIHLLVLVVALRCLVGAVHKGSSFTAWTMTLVLAAAFIAGLPSPSQGLYWLIGAIAYFVPFNAFFGLLACVAYRVWSPGRWKKAHYAILALCLCVTMGSNEITAVATIFFMVCGVVLAHLHNHPAKGFLGRLLLAALLLFCIVIGSPGNFARASGERAWQWYFLLPVMGGSIEGYKWFWRTPLIPCLLVCAFLLKPRWDAEFRAFPFKKLVALILVAACALFLGEFLFVYLASGRAPYARINNAIYHSAFAFGLFSMALLFAPIQTLFARMEARWSRKKILTALGCVFAAVVLLQPGAFYAIRNTVNGEFVQYREIWLWRLSLTPPKGTAKGKVIDMPAQKTRPFPLVFRDLKEHQDKHQWIPDVFARYHDFGSVRIVPGDQLEKDR